jgi:hypothetical protein
MFSKLSDFEKCTILIGNFLGDGSYDNRGSILKNRHSNKQNDYVKWLEYLYDNMGVLQDAKYDHPYPTNIDPSAKISLVKAKVPIATFFETNNFFKYSNNKYTKTGNRTYYKKGTKIVSEYALRNIHPFGLLLWFLDDGSLSVKRRVKKDGSQHGVQRQAILCTHSFTYDEHVTIEKVFKSRFGIEIRIHNHSCKNPVTKKVSSTGVHTYINATNFRKFYDVVRPYLHLIPESMKYKFDMQYEINKVKNSKFLMENYNCY